MSGPAFAITQERRAYTVRETHIGSEIKDMAQEVVRFGERCVQAGRDWLNERREDMTNRNYENRRDPYQPGQTRGQHEQRYSQQERGTQFDDDYQSDRYAGGRDVQQQYRGERIRPTQWSGRNQPYGQSDERTQSAQSAGWEEERGWDYSGGPERYASSDYNQDRNYRRGSESIGGQREWGTYGAGPGEYTGSGRQGMYGSDYNTYGRNQGYGEGSGYTRPQQETGRRSQFSGGYRQPGYGAYGGESAGSGGRTPMYGGSSYTDEGEMSGYRSGGIGAGSRYGSSQSQFGTTGYESYRGRGPKNYTRSDERITEEINERLTDDDDLDATEITVRVANGTVTLEGSVDQRWMKHRAEDIADACSGVKEVDNRIQVTSASARSQAGVESRGKVGKSTTGTTTPGTH